MPTLGPRIVIAGTHSGVGKTTVATGLMAALAGAGLRVVSAKIGPDFIDPGYHALATGRPGRSLDTWLSGEDHLGSLAAEGADGTDLLVAEGVMGLFDGSAQPGCDGSTAAVARLLEAPVVLVVDASAMSGSVAALVHGYRDLDRRVQVAGVILNRVGGPGHEALLREALQPLRVAVLGVLGHHEALAWRERHLGLVPVAEHPGPTREAVRALGAVVGAAYPAPPRPAASGWPSQPGPPSASPIPRTSPCWPRRARSCWRSTHWWTRRCPRDATPCTPVEASPRSSRPPSGRTGPSWGPSGPQWPLAWSPGPSAAACCGCAKHWTGSRWWGLCPPRAG